jgi:EAL domain-containing protein (putative c-di-GMP-specific phosphodiesterase class I)
MRSAAQGYYFSRPLAADRMEDWLSERTAVPVRV